MSRDFPLSIVARSSSGKRKVDDDAIDEDKEGRERNKSFSPQQQQQQTFYAY